MREQHLREIELLYVKNYDMLISYAVHILHNKELAEEAVQETFRIACQKADAACECVNKEGWLLNTLKNVISNMEKLQFRANRRLEEYTTWIATLQDKINYIDLDVLYNDIAGLEEYILIKELVLEEKSIHELAESRGISEAACKKRVQRAKQVLRKRLNDINDS